jgi:hypothetical protein
MALLLDAVGTERGFLERAWKGMRAGLKADVYGEWLFAIAAKVLLGKTDKVTASMASGHARRGLKISMKRIEQDCGPPP